MGPTVAAILPVPAAGIEASVGQTTSAWPSADGAAELDRLVTLRDEGKISSQDYELAKQKILGGSPATAGQVA